ncbi:hypothetical protein L9F63_024914, partial [Diploptera punctata]
PLIRYLCNAIVNIIGKCLGDRPISISSLSPDSKAPVEVCHLVPFSTCSISTSLAKNNFMPKLSELHSAGSRFLHFPTVDGSMLRI